MTREEEVRKTSIKEFSGITVLPGVKIFIECCRLAFQKGAKWADDNPKSPWINVEDNLPYEYPELLKDRDTTVPVLTKTKWLGYFVQFMYYIETRKSWEFSEGGDVECWMPIPKLPKEKE